MPYAIDLFCGAGGFSEGILQAGFDILFSSDKSPMVQETYVNRHNQLGLLEGIDTHFELADIQELTAERIFDVINNLRFGNIFEPGDIDVIFGGPPCQGFSRLGKRDASDPRNMLFHEYLRIIRDVHPRYVVMENVTGILDMLMLDFPSVVRDTSYIGQKLVKEILKEELQDLGYNLLDVQILNSADFGVPQQRNRVVFLAYRNDVQPLEYPEGNELPEVTVRQALEGLYNNELPLSEFAQHRIDGETPTIIGAPIPRERITNMEESRHDVLVSQRFSLYHPGENTRAVINRLKNEGINLRDTRPELFNESLFQVNLAINTEVIHDTLIALSLFEEKFKSKRWLHFTNRQLAILYSLINNEKEFNIVLKSLAGRLNTSIDKATIFWETVHPLLNTEYDADTFHHLLINGEITDRIGEAILTKKSIRTRLNPDSVSPTIVTLPDDFIHPYFDRVLTVREMARIQSFDDSFEFLGKRTTGGEKRSQETPQFTQVGNAVPPLLARAIAFKVREAIDAN
ncbi:MULTISPECIES: DNA cytosine methyltransferase [Streptococcus]|jgi:DNA (cytosine-5-)-methyltransferase|uniref:DNA cytosine methyltransferase n=1 Tax=Streptococcus TaxID=1301 RepID=UPI00189A8662|nr:DNA cytosine methyltransferase [Streptococcus salivarius]MDB8602553.1 DNA cytosine methyltransferase [Streptococcus salivarius]MDB8612440.1 DNA cytosine methyltransferase [Streptococcus salivarius]